MLFMKNARQKGTHEHLEISSLSHDRGRSLVGEWPTELPLCGLCRPRSRKAPGAEGGRRRFFLKKKGRSGLCKVMFFGGFEEIFHLGLSKSKPTVEQNHKKATSKAPLDFI